jgi:hypothetical protein
MLDDMSLAMLQETECENPKPEYSIEKHLYCPCMDCGLLLDPVVASWKHSMLMVTGKNEMQSDDAKASLEVPRETVPEGAEMPQAEEVKDNSFPMDMEQLPPFCLMINLQQWTTRCHCWTQISFLKMMMITASSLLAWHDGKLANDL